LSAEQNAVGGIFDDLLRCDTERGPDHGDLDELALAGPPPVLQRDQAGEDGVESGDGVGLTVGNSRLIVGEPGYPGQPGHLLHRLRVADLVLPRPVEPECRHPHHDQRGVDGGQIVVADAPILEDAGAEILDEDVTAADELLEQCNAARVPEIEGQPLLVGVRSMKERTPLPEPIVVGTLVGDEPHPVDALDGLDVYDLGAQRCEEVPGDRSGPELGQVEHPQAAQRTLWCRAQQATAGVVVPSRPDRVRVLAKARRGSSGSVRRA